MNEEGQELNYIGSTYLSLDERMSHHRSDTNNCSSKIIFKTCSNINIILIEPFSCNSKEELLFRERFYYDKYDCVNIIRPILYPEERENYQQTYHQKYKKEHKEQLLEYNSKYKADHKEDIQKYYEENKIEILEYQQNYYEDHKEERAEYNAKKYKKNKCEFKCDCGSTINNKINIRIHEKSKKHIKFLEQNK